MPDYIIHDGNGKILERLISVDPSVVEGKANVLEVTRAVAEGITSADKVEDGKIVKKTEVELAAEAKVITDAAKVEEDKRLAVIADLKKVGLLDETISYLMRTTV